MRFREEPRAHLFQPYFPGLLVPSLHGKVNERKKGWGEGARVRNLLIKVLLEEVFVILILSPSLPITVPWLLHLVQGMKKMETVPRNLWKFR